MPLSCYTQPPVNAAAIKMNKWMAEARRWNVAPKSTAKMCALKIFSRLSSGKLFHILLLMHHVRSVSAFVHCFLDVNEGRAAGGWRICLSPFGRASATICQCNYLPVQRGTSFFFFCRIIYSAEKRRQCGAEWKLTGDAIALAGMHLLWQP